ncbi:MAG: hypothetical protein ACR2PL_12970 [Dehalococcoidia bacterium]
MVTQIERPNAIRDLLLDLDLPELLEDEERLSRRSQAMQSLDADIAPRLRRLLPAWLAFAPTTSGLTMYDSILRSAPDTGGHWTIAARSIGWLTHAVWSYSLLVDFDEREQPCRLRIRGRIETSTEDLSTAGLDLAFAWAAANGPLRTGAAQAFVGISL